ncbi:MAG TPA: hypothetical protein PLL64_14780 [Rhodothermales bacterium]|nr:hypothetical protein [Rhodothermales bacterium]HRR09178.1 hypothetical protein [Rhodothermales bacterium]
MNTIELAMEAQPTFSVTDNSVKGILKIKGISDQVIRSVNLEFIREVDVTHRDQDGYSDTKTKKTTMGRSRAIAPTSIGEGEEVQLDFEISFLYEKSFIERMKSKEGMMGKIFKHIHEAYDRDEYFIEATVDLADVAMDPSVRTTVKRI